MNAAKKRPASKKPRRPRAASRRRNVVLAVSLGAALVLAPFLALAAWARLGGAGQGKRFLMDWPRAVDERGAAERLARAGIVTSPRLFAWYLRVFADVGEFEPGPHLLNDRLSARELVQRLERSRRRPERKVTVPEGWNHVQLARRLEESEVCSEEGLRKAVRDRALLAELGLSGESAEGFLFPATYALGVDTSPAQVVRLMVREFRNRMNALGAANPGSLEALRAKRGWGELEVTTLASIVEKEAVVDDERPIIARVYLNRLDDPEHRPEKMLQADPTAAYGCVVEPERASSCTTFDGKVTPALLRDPDNRYNTYKHPGLPPGPIASPGEKSLAAVLAPSDADFLYFVAAGGGRHRFSRSLAEHNRAIGERR